MILTLLRLEVSSKRVINFVYTLISMIAPKNIHKLKFPKKKKIARNNAGERACTELLDPFSDHPLRNQ